MLLTELMSAQAVRSSVTLEPIDGPGGRIFPPTYPGHDAAQHVVERLPDGTCRVLVDSVASQASRMTSMRRSSRSDLSRP